MNFNKISDCILTQYLIEDMVPAADKAQYGNIQGESVQHYFLKMVQSDTYGLCTCGCRGKKNWWAKLILGVW